MACFTVRFIVHPFLEKLFFADARRFFDVQRCFSCAVFAAFRLMPRACGGASFNGAPRLAFHLNAAAAAAFYHGLPHFALAAGAAVRCMCTDFMRKRKHHFSAWCKHSRRRASGGIFGT